MLRLEDPVVRQAFVVTFLLFAARSLLACQCPDPPTESVAAARSDVVAVGRISGLSRVPRLPIGAVSLEDVVIATMAVDTSWRRAESTLQIVAGFSDCDYRDFVVGETYLVFAASEIPGVGKRADVVWAPRCWPTRRHKGAIAELGEPMFKSKGSVESGMEGDEQRRIRSRQGVLVALVGLIVLAALALVFFRRRRGGVTG